MIGEGFDDADDNDADCADDDDGGFNASFSQLLSQVNWTARTLITFLSFDLIFFFLISSFFF